MIIRAKVDSDEKSDVSAILLWLQSNPQCCDENVTFDNSTTYITVIVPGEGDDPEYYGETAVEDWDEWNEYLCHNAKLWLDELIHHTGNVEAALNYGGMTVALIAAAIVGVSFFVVGGVVAMPVIYAAVAGLVAGISATVFEDAADDLTTAYDDIICAIMLGLSLGDAVEDALGVSTAWALFFQYIDYSSAQAILYEGGDGITFLESETDDTCTDCVYPQVGEYLTKWEWIEEDEYLNWVGLSVWHLGGVPPASGSLKIVYSTGHSHMGCNRLRIIEGLGTSGDGHWVDIHRISFDYSIDHENYGELRLAVEAVGGDLEYDYEKPEGFDWIHVDIIYSTPIRVTGFNKVAWFQDITSTAGNAYFDNVEIDWDANPT
jgi:hypothetical protein